MICMRVCESFFLASMKFLVMQLCYFFYMRVYMLLHASFCFLIHASMDSNYQASMVVSCHASMSICFYASFCFCIGHASIVSVYLVTYEFFMCTSIGLTPRQERFKKGHLVWALLLLPNLNETLAKFFKTR